MSGRSPFDPPAPSGRGNARPAIRAVFFDAGATLLYTDPPVEQVYGRIFAEDGARFSHEQLGEALRATWVEVQAEKPGDRYGGVRGEVEFWRGFLERVKRRLDGRPLSETAFERLVRHFRDSSAWAVYPDVVPTLEALLSRGLRLAVVSNWDSYLPRLLEMRGLSSFFHTVSVSAIERTGKPDAEIFRRTCERLRVAAADALHVGDSLREDFEGARGAGLGALLLDRQDQFPSVPERIRTLAELLDRL